MKYTKAEDATMPIIAFRADTGSESLMMLLFPSEYPL